MQLAEFQDIAISQGFAKPIDPTDEADAGGPCRVQKACTQLAD